MSEGRLITVGKRSRRLDYHSTSLPSTTSASSMASTSPVNKKDRVDSEASSTTSERTDSECSRDQDIDAQLSARIKVKGCTSPKYGAYSSRPSSAQSIPYDRKFRKYSETSEDSISDSSPKKRFRAADFNLDDKIAVLPSLSLEEFQMKKKQRNKRSHPMMKKAINTVVPATIKKEKSTFSAKPMEIHVPEGATEDRPAMKTVLVGCQKRKARKQSITRLDTDNARATRDSAVVDQDVLNNIGLATLAEVASAKSKFLLN